MMPTPTLSRVKREGKATPRIDVLRFSVAGVERGRHREPGSDQPHEPMEVHARFANRAYEPGWCTTWAC